MTDPFTGPGKRRMPMGFQVWVGLGVLLTLLAGISLLAILLVNGLKGDENRLNDQYVPYASAVATAALNAKGAANDQRGFLMTGDRGFVAEADRRIGAARSAFAAAAAAAVSAEQRRAVDQARAGFERWVQVVEREIATFQAGDRTGPVRASLGSDRQLRKAYEQSLDTAQALGTRSIASTDNSVTAALSRSVRTLLGGLAVALAVGFGVAFWLVRSIALPVHRLVALLAPADLPHRS